MIDEQRRADAVSRERACTEFERPILLVAGAGTGKTATLVARVVVWITGPGWERALERHPDDRDDELAKAVLAAVVAITFTDAAAAEMAGRIEAALGALEASKSVIGLDPALLAVEGDVLNARVRALRQEIDALVAVTFHSWCHKFLSAHAIEAGLSPGFQIDATKTLARRALREAFDALLADDADPEIGRDLVTLAAAGKSPQKLEALANTLIAGGATSGDVGLHVYADANEGEELFRFLAAALADLRPALEVLQNCSGNAKATGACAQQCLALAQEVAGRPPSTFAEWAAFAADVTSRFEAYVAKIGEWGKGKFNKTEEKELGALADGVPEPAKKLLAALNHAIKSDMDLAQPLVRVLHAALAGFEATARQQGFVTFDQLLRETARLLHENPAVARDARASIDQLLVDEFQDTDEIQCSIVRSLALEGDGARPSLFLIGDPKQSIYAFRGADMTAFDAVTRNLLDAGGDELELSVNFRSVPAILDEVDRNFASMFERLPGLQPAFASLLPQAGRTNGDAPDGAGAHIEHWISWARDEDGVYVQGEQSADAVRHHEGLAIAADVAALSRGDAHFDWSRVAILIQTQTHVEALLEPLRELGVPFELGADKSYFRRREVVDAVSSVRAAFDPDDELALAALLRAPFIGVPDAALLTLWNAGFPERVRAIAQGPDDDFGAVEAAVAEAARHAREQAVDAAGCDGWTGRVLHAARTLVAGYRASLEEPLAVALEIVRSSFGQERVEAARFLGGLRSANLARLWHTLTQRVVDEGLDVPELLRMLRADVGLVDEERANVTARSTTNAVQLMTMHGSKGLEFEHVYLAQLGRERSKHTSRAVLRRNGQTAWCVDGIGSPSYPVLAVHQRLVEAAEGVRLFYVAATRARERLVLSGPRKEAARAAWRSAERLDDLLRGQDELARLRGEQTAHADDHGAHWRFAADHARGAPVARPPQSAPAMTVADALALEAAREAAALHAARPRTRGPSTLHSTSAPLLELSPDEAELARHVGTLVHRWFEAGGERELEHLTRGLELTPNLLAAARQVLELARAGGLVDRFRSLEADIVARELPYLAPPTLSTSPGAAVDAEAGSIDLVLFDDASSTWTVVDFKTDRVTTAEEIAAAVSRHAPQLEAYALAVAAATGGTVRKELWLLRAGAVESVGEPVTAPR